MATSITLSGFKEFAAKCQGMTAEIMEEMDLECEDATREWASLAKRSAPKDQGFLAGQITNQKISEANWETVSPADYSAFMEWGTKTRVRVPPGLEAYAQTFRGGGMGSGGAKQMIYAWMTRVGIPAQFQWIVFISIIVKGVHPHPFFFIQMPIVEQKFLKAAQQILNTEH